MNIIFFWEYLDPNHFNENKKLTYFKVFNELTAKKARVYIATGKNVYIGDKAFKVRYVFENENLQLIESTVRADFVFDRSGSMKFPKEDDDFVLNSLEFKKFCKDKFIQYQKFPEFFPKTCLFLKESVNTFDQEKEMILKPRYGMKGKGVVKAKLKDLKIDDSFYYDENYILQELVYTIFETRRDVYSCISDLRLIFLNGEILASYYRIGNKHGITSNINQGGTRVSVKEEDLTERIISFSKSVDKLVRMHFGNPFYAMDIAVTCEEVLLFELNSQPGFPVIDMVSDNFVKELSTRLINPS